MKERGLRRRKDLDSDLLSNDLMSVAFPSLVQTEMGGGPSPDPCLVHEFCIDYLLIPYRYFRVNLIRNIPPVTRHPVVPDQSHSNLRLSGAYGEGPITRSSLHQRRVT